MAQTMIQKDWNCFARTGKIEDYLCYREAQEETLSVTLRWAGKLPEKSRKMDEKVLYGKGIQEVLENGGQKEEQTDRGTT